MTTQRALDGGIGVLFLLTLAVAVVTTLLGWPPASWLIAAQLSAMGVYYTVFTMLFTALPGLFALVVLKVVLVLLHNLVVAGDDPEQRLYVRAQPR